MKTIKKVSHLEENIVCDLCEEKINTDFGGWIEDEDTNEQVHIRCIELARDHKKLSVILKNVERVKMVKTE